MKLRLIVIIGILIVLPLMGCDLYEFINSGEEKKHQEESAELDPNNEKNEPSVKDEADESLVDISEGDLEVDPSPHWNVKADDYDDSFFDDFDEFENDEFTGDGRHLTLSLGEEVKYTMSDRSGDIRVRLDSVEYNSKGAGEEMIRDGYNFYFEVINDTNQFYYIDGTHFSVFVNGETEINIDAYSNSDSDDIPPGMSRQIKVGTNLLTYELELSYLSIYFMLNYNSSVTQWDVFSEQIYW